LKDFIDVANLSSFLQITKIVSVHALFIHFFKFYIVLITKRKKATDH